MTISLLNVMFLNLKAIQLFKNVLFEFENFYYSPQIKEQIANMYFAFITKVQSKLFTKTMRNNNVFIFQDFFNSYQKLLTSSSKIRALWVNGCCVGFTS